MPRLKVTCLRRELSAELKKGRITEASVIGASSWHYEGLCNWETNEITVNPSVSVVDTLVHELLHRRFPGWSEERVRRDTWRVIRSLSQADIMRWYQKYKRLARKTRTPVHASV